MLLNNFYKILELHSEDGEIIKAKIEINSNHEIFSGHFPNNPIVPGVCLIQIVKETLSKHLGKELTLAEGKNIKFTAVVNPNEYKQLEVEHILKSTENGIFRVNSKIFNLDTIFLKFQGSFRS